MTATTSPRKDRSDAPAESRLDALRREYETGRTQLAALTRRMKELESQLRRLELEPSAHAPSTSAPQDRPPVSVHVDAQVGTLESGSVGILPLRDLIAAMVREVEGPADLPGRVPKGRRTGRSTFRPHAGGAHVPRRRPRGWVLVLIGISVAAGLLLWLTL